MTIAKVFGAVLSAAFFVSAAHAATRYVDRVMSVVGQPACMVELQPGMAVNSNMIVSVLQNGETTIVVDRGSWWKSNKYKDVPGVVVRIAPDKSYGWPGTDAERAERYGRYMAAINACRGG